MDLAGSRRGGESPQAMGKNRALTPLSGRAHTHDVSLPPRDVKRTSAFTRLIESGEGRISMPPFRSIGWAV